VSTTITRFLFYMTKLITELIRSGRTCQRLITIINKGKSIAPNNSPLSQYSLFNFCLKESSQRDLPEHVKNLSCEEMTLFSVADTLNANSDL